MKSTHNKLYFIKNINEIDEKIIESIFYQLPPSRQQKAKNCYYIADKKIKIFEKTENGNARYHACPKKDL